MKLLIKNKRVFIITNNVFSHCYIVAFGLSVYSYRDIILGINIKKFISWECGE